MGVRVCAFARDTIKRYGRIDGLLRDFLSIPIKLPGCCCAKAIARMRNFI